MKKFLKSLLRILSAVAIFCGTVLLAYVLWQPGSNKPLPKFENNAIWLGHGWLGDDLWFKRNKKNFEDFFAAVLEEGDRALALTPELLPVLKKAGVVDSGGVGLMVIIKGFASELTGEEIADSITEAEMTQTDEDFGDNSDIINMDLGEIQYAYCTEFFIINMKRARRFPRLIDFANV